MQGPLGPRDRRSAALTAGALVTAGGAAVLLDQGFSAVFGGTTSPGDAILIHLGQLMRASLRRGDTVARFGGDELAAPLPNTSATGAFRRAEGLRLKIRETPLRHDGGEVQFTVSAGVAHMPVGHPDLEGLYIAADQALYRAKHRGRDRVVMG